MPISQEPKTPVYCLRRGTLYGAALGLLVGLVNIAVEGYGEREAIGVWRNWILAGAGVGFVVGAIVAWRRRGEDEQVGEPRA